MEFCLKCDNMYYMKKNENNDLIYHCNFCGDENEELLVKRNLKVYKYTKVTKAKDIHINEYTKFDPTLPHTMNIKCPNQDCLSNKTPDSFFLLSYILLAVFVSPLSSAFHCLLFT